MSPDYVQTKALAFFVLKCFELRNVYYTELC